MSAKIKINSLSEHQKEQIKANLYFVCKEFKPQRGFRYEAPTTDKNVAFYLADNDSIYLPYTYAASLLNYIPNQHKNYIPCNSMFTGLLRDNQKIVVIDLMQQLNQYGTTTIGLYPGFGKTVVGAYLTCYLQHLTLILLHLDTLIEQHVATFLNNTNCVIYIVGEGNKKVKKMQKDHPHRFYIPSANMHQDIHAFGYENSAVYMRYHVIICMEQRYEQIPKFVRKQVKTLIVDEAHSFCTPSRVPALLSVQPYYIILQTATIERDDHMHEMLYSLVGTHGVFLENTKHAHVFILPTNITIESKKDRYDITNYDQLVKDSYANPLRMQILLELLKRNVGYRTMILTAFKERCQTIFNEVSALALPCDYVNGDKKEFQPVDILIGTNKKVGTGFDPLASSNDPNLKHYQIVIMDFSIKKYAVLTQSAGRAMRSQHPVIIHLVDNNPIYENHLKKNLNYYRKRNYTVNYLNVNDLDSFSLQKYGIPID